MRKILLTHTIISFFLIKPVIGQQDSLITIFKNDSFNFRIIRTSSKILDSNRIELSAVLIESMISKMDKEKIANLKYSDWLRLLNNEKTDWAANLYLYEIYRRDASIFENIKSIERWRVCCKKEDVDFWRKTLIDSEHKAGSRRGTRS